MYFVMITLHAIITHVAINLSVIVPCHPCTTSYFCGNVLFSCIFLPVLSCLVASACPVTSVCCWTKGLWKFTSFSFAFLVYISIILSKFFTCQNRNFINILLCWVLVTTRGKTSLLETDLQLVRWPCRRNLEVRKWWQGMTS